MNLFLELHVRVLIPFLLISFIFTYWSNQTLADAFCNGIRDKKEEFQQRYSRELPAVRSKDWKLSDLKVLSGQLEDIKDGTYRSLPPVNVSALKREIDRVIMWGTLNDLDDNFSLDEQVDGDFIERVFAMSLVIVKRLRLGDQCD